MQDLIMRAPLKEAPLLALFYQRGNGAAERLRHTRGSPVKARRDWSNNPESRFLEFTLRQRLVCCPTFITKCPDVVNTFLLGEILDCLGKYCSHLKCTTAMLQKAESPVSGNKKTETGKLLFSKPTERMPYLVIKLYVPL